MVRNLPAMWETWVGNIPWRREWLPILVFWPGEFCGQRSLSGYGPWGLKELDLTEQLSLHFIYMCVYIYIYTHTHTAVELLDPMVVLFFILLSNFHIVFQVTGPLYITTKYTRVSFCLHPQKHFLFAYFLMMAILTGDTVVLICISLIISDV